MTKHVQDDNEIKTNNIIIDEVSSSPKENQSLSNPISFLREMKDNFSTAAKEGFGTKAKNVATSMSVGDIVVPLCANLTQRQLLANRGIYAGVEYEVCSLSSSLTNEERNITSFDNKEEITQPQVNHPKEEDLTAMIKPAYKLRDHLERNDWPVSVRPKDEVPLWLSKTTYEAGTMLGTLSLSLTYLITAAALSFLFTFAYVPSESMIPSLKPGNVVLVSRSIFLQPQVGDVILFDPPPNLKKIITEQEKKNNINQETSATTMTKSDKQQFLKRIVAIPGENVGVKNSQPYVDLNSNTNNNERKILSSNDETKEENNNSGSLRRPRRYRVDIVGPYVRQDIFSSDSWNRAPQKLGRNEYFVAGDNGFRSVDSRVWGNVDRKYIFGKAKLIVWPLEDFGPIQDGNISEIEKE
uniref:Mitochondrial inner membrane protease subunit n=1 Tax=Eucampia antarctica TaxID=49252 RepID=A0A7S2VZ24_9STRA